MANLKRFLFYAMAVCLSTQASAQLFQIPPTPSQTSVVATPATINGDGVPDLIVGTGVGGGLVNIFSGVDGAAIVGGPPFGPGFTGGVRVAAADFTGDGIAEVVAGSGPGAAEVRVFDGATAAMLASFSPFGASTGGVYVAAGDINGDGHPDLVVGGGEGVAQAISFDGSTHSPLASGYPFGFGYTGGVTVALGDVNGDGRLDYITGMAAGGLVSVFDGVTLLPLAIGFPYGPTYTGGVYVAAGDITGDGRAEVVTGQRNAPSATVSVFDVENQSLLASVVPHPGASGVTVAVGDVNGDGFGDLLTGAGPGVAPQIRLFSGATHTELLNLLAFPASFHGGVFVATTASQGLRFTSADATAFTTGVADTFTITTAGGINPPIVITSGTLPSGVTFTDNGDGTATLAGLPEAGTAGIYPLTFQAGTTVTETQNFTLTVQEPPAITSVDATTFLLDTPGTFVVTTTGFPTPELTQTGALPAGVTFVDNGDGTATVDGTPESAGVFPLTLTATNPAGTANQTFTLTVDDVPVANADSYTVNEGGTLTVPAGGIMANDTNVVGTLTATLIAGPAHATSFTFSSDGSFSYTHDGSETPLTDTFTYQINDGTQDSNVATVTITITPQNDAPVATNDAYSVAEGGTLLQSAALGVLANDTDVDTPGPLTAVLVTGPTHAAVFTLNADGSFSYLHDGSETLTDSFTYRASDGTLQSNLATVTITITPVADGPTAANDTYAVAELGTLTVPAPGVLGNDQDPEGNPLTAVLVSGPAHATTFTFNTDGSFIYTNNGDEAPTDTFTYRAQAGGLDSNIATVTITIANVNDPPAAMPDSYTVNEGGTLNPAAPGVLGNDLDPDSVLTASLVSGPAHASSFTLNPDGSFSYTHDGSETPLTDSFTYAASDGIAPPSPATVTITITPVSEPPSLDLDADDSSGATGADYQLTFTEGDQATFIQDATDATITDADSPTLSSITVTLTNLLDPTFEVLDVDLVTGGFDATFTKAYDPTTDPTKGVLTITTTTPQPIADFIILLRRVTYQNTDSAPDLTGRVIEFVVNDGTGNSNKATTTVTLTEANSPPTADDDNYNVNEGGTLTVPAPGVLDGDEDADSPGATLTATLVSPPAHHAGTFTLNPDGSFTYVHNDNQTATTDSFTYTVTSSAGGTSAPATVTITINLINDAPAITAGGTITFTEGNLATVIDSTITVTDVDDTNLESATVQISVNYVNGQDILAMPVTPGIGSAFDPATGTLTLTGTATVAAYQAALRSVTYFNGSNTPSQLPRTVSWTVNDGALNSNTAFSTINVVAVNDPPIVANETFDLLGNTELRVDMTAGTTPHTSETTTGPSAVEGVLDNDGDPEGDPIAVTGILNCTVPDTTPPFDCTLTGGAVVHVEANGEFSYTPAPGATSGSFTYTVTDTPAQGIASSVNGTVTFNFLQRVWYVDADFAGTSNGTSIAPFTNFTSISGAGGSGDSDSAGDYIFVHAASASVTSSLELEANQHLLGEGVGLSIPVNLNGNGSPTNLVPAGVNPIVTSAADTIRATQAMPAEIRGLTIASTASNAIDVTATGALTGSATLAITNNTFSGATTETIDFNGGATGTLALTIGANTWSGTHGGNGIDVQSTVAGAAISLALTNNTPIATSGTAILVNQVAGAITITDFSGMSIPGNHGGTGVSITNAKFDQTPGGGYQTVNGGALAIGASGNGVGSAGMVLTNVSGDLTFTDLDIFADNGAALSIDGTNGAGAGVNTGAGTGTRVVVSGSPTLASAGGPVVNILDTTITMPISTANVTSSPTTGISLSNVVDGTTTASFSVSSGAIAGTTGHAFSVTGSNATVSYGGTIASTTAAARSVNLVNNGSDTISFTGAISGTGNSGIFLDNNDQPAAATMSFSGGITLNGTNATFTATNGGTVTATGINTIGATTAPTGPALNVASTTIGASNLTFRSISANGGSRGIILNTTGSSGGLTVTGNGGACIELSTTCTGGWIRSTTGADDSSTTPVGTGIVLNNTSNVSLTRMRLNDHTNYAIRGTSVDGFVFDSGIVDGANGTNVATPFNDGSLVFFGVTGVSSGMTGTSSITNSTIRGGHQRNVAIDNSVGTLNLTVSNNVIKRTSDAAGDDGFFLEADTTANVTLSVTNNTFARHGGDHINVTLVNSATMTLTVTGNTLHGNYTGTPEGNHPIGLGQGMLIFGASFNGTLNYDVSSNTVNGARQGGSIHVNKGSGTATFSGTITKNVIGTSGIAGSGGSESFGIITGTRGAGGSHTTLIDQNQVRQYFDRGIVLQTGEGSAAFNATVTNNTVTEFQNTINALHGIQADNGILAADNNAVCLQIAGNSVATAGAEANGGADIRLRRGSNTTVRLPGLGGTTNAAATTLLQTNNPTATTINVTGNGFSGGAACPTP